MSDPFYYIGLAIRESALSVKAVIDGACEILKSMWSGINGFFSQTVPQTFDTLKQNISAKIFDFAIGISTIGIKVSEGFETLKQNISAKIFEFAIGISTLGVKLSEGFESLKQNISAKIFEFTIGISMLGIKFSEGFESLKQSAAIAIIGLGTSVCWFLHNNTSEPSSPRFPGCSMLLLSRELFYSSHQRLSRRFSRELRLLLQQSFQQIKATITNMVAGVSVLLSADSQRLLLDCLLRLLQVSVLLQPQSSLGFKAFLARSLVLSAVSFLVSLAKASQAIKETSHEQRPLRRVKVQSQWRD